MLFCIMISCLQLVDVGYIPLLWIGLRLILHILSCRELNKGFPNLWLNRVQQQWHDHWIFCIPYLKFKITYFIFHLLFRKCLADWDHEKKFSLFFCCNLKCGIFKTGSNFGWIWIGTRRGVIWDLWHYQWKEWIGNKGQKKLQ